MQKLPLLLRAALIGIAWTAFTFLTSWSVFGGESDEPVYIVEIANFSCPYCLKMETVLPQIQQATEETGGKFVFAPISWGEQSSWRDRVYYAARNQGEAVAEAVRRSLFSAVQDLMLPLEDLHQAIVWLKQDVKNVSIDFDRLMQDARSEQALESHNRGMRLAANAGVDKLPAYLFIKNADVVAILSRSQSLSTATALKLAVLEKVKELSNQETTTHAR